MLTSSNNIRSTYLRRVAALPLITFVSLLLAFNIKKAEASIHDASKMKEEQSAKTPVDDTLKNKKIEPMIREEAIHLNNDTSIRLYGKRIEFNSTTYLNSLDKNKPLIILDGKNITWEEFNNLPHEVIKQIDVFKGIEATRKYSNPGKNGVIEVTTKASNDENLQLQSGDQPTFEKVFTGAENPPVYNNSNLSFIDYIKANLQYPEEAVKNKTEGKVVISFIVDQDGKLSNFKPLTSLGSGLEEEAIRLIKNSAPWRPAIQNHKTVVFEVKQEIQFALNDKISVTQQDELPQYPGGLEEWRKYIFRNTDFKVLNEHPAPNGKYSVVVSFIIRKDGSITNVSAETKSGYVAEDEAIRVISSGKKWQPARKYGSLTDTPVKQTMTYSVTNNRWGIVEINLSLLVMFKQIM